MTAIRRFQQGASRRFSFLRVIPQKKGGATLPCRWKTRDLRGGERLKYFSSFTSEQSPSTPESSLVDPRILLDRKARPLGTLDWKDWESGMADIARQLGGIPARGDDREKWTGAGARLFAVEKMLERLKQEGATRSFVSKKFLNPKDLWSVSIAILQSWLDLNKAFPRTSIALVRAQMCMEEVISGTKKLLEESGGHIKDDERYTAVLEAFLDLALSWCELKTIQGIDSAVDLLCSAEALELFQTNPNLAVPVYHSILHESLAIVGAEQSSAKLLKHMEKTGATLTDWHAIRPTEKQFEQALGYSDGTLLTDTLDRSVAIQQAESSSLFRKIIARVKEATKRDDELVAEAKEVLETLEVKQMRILLSMALAEYYVRLSDVVNATGWIVRFDPGDLSSYHEKTSDLLGKCIVLWIKRSEGDPSAVYRAEEMLALLETVCVQNDKPVDYRLLFIVAKAWLKSGEISGIQKSLEVASRHAGTPDKQLLKVVLAAIQKISQVPDHVLLKAHGWFRELTGVIDDDANLVEYAQILITALVNNGRPDEANRLLDMLLGRNLVVSPDVLQSIFECKKNPKNFANMLFERLKNAKPEALPGITLAAISALKPDSQGEHLNTLNRILSTDILATCDKSGKSELFRGSVEKLVEWDEPLFALDVLERAERECSEGQASSPLPSSCYKKTIISLTLKGGGHQARRLFAKARAGPAALDFGSQFCLTYMNSLGGANSWVTRECELILNWLTEVYRSTGDLKFKPTAKMYSRILQLMDNEAFNTTFDKRSELADKAIGLIDQMSNLSAHDGDLSPYLKCMQIALSCVAKERFSRAHAIYQKVRATDGVNVDGELLFKMMWACTSVANVEDLPIRLKTATDLFGEGRRNGIVTEKCYHVAFRCISRLAKESRVREALLTELFLCCCSDGFLSEKTREEVQSILSAESWARVYTTNLGDGGNEPASWSRNIEARGDVVKMKEVI